MAIGGIEALCPQNQSMKTRKAFFAAGCLESFQGHLSAVEVYILPASCLFYCMATRSAGILPRKETVGQSIVPIALDVPSITYLGEKAQIPG